MESGAVHVIDFDIVDIPNLAEYMIKYGDILMDLAYASLMLISDKLDLRKIITLDNDFYVYRKKTADIW
jgi:predicted nucleic acid-binding protein